VVTHTCGASYLKSRGRRILVQCQSRQTYKTLSEKQTKNERLGMAYVKERQPSKPWALTSIPRTDKIKKEKNE
jgi:hypothetical protein